MYRNRNSIHIYVLSGKRYNKLYTKKISNLVITVLCGYATAARYVRGVGGRAFRSSGMRRGRVVTVVLNTPGTGRV